MILFTFSTTIRMTKLIIFGRASKQAIDIFIWSDQT